MSWDTSTTPPAKFLMASARLSIISMSSAFVGSSSNRRWACCLAMWQKTTLAFWPSESWDMTWRNYVALERGGRESPSTHERRTPAEATLVGLSLPIAQFRTMAALLRASSRTVSKALGDQTRDYKVAVLGAAGGIGQPCGLLMKMVRAAMSLRFTSRRNPQGTDGQSAPIWRTRR